MFTGAALLIIIIAVIFALAILGLYIWFLVVLMNLLNAISIENRKLPGGQVFLILIPFFSMIWSFIMFDRISQSIRLECERLGIERSGDYLKGLGMAYAIVGLVAGVFNFIEDLKGLSSVISLVGLIIWIIYWVKAAEFKRLITAANKEAKFQYTDNSDLLDS